MTDIANLVIGLGALVAAWTYVAWRARRNARKEIEHDDMEHAETIRRRVDRADKRMREFDDAGWRD